MRDKFFSTKTIAGTGILTAVEIVLYLLGSYIAIGGININLALVPICVGAILFGPITGSFLGLINGVCVLLTPFTQTYFMDTATFGPLCVLGTFIICLSKCTVAGLVAYFVYKPFKDKVIGSIISSLSVPIINTGLFVLGALIFYRVEFAAILSMVITFNFLIEIGTSIVLSPVIVRVVTILKKPEENN